MINWQVPPNRRAVFVGVLVITAASMLVTALGSFRIGGYLLAIAMLTAAVARAVLPEMYCLGLIVRSRLFDVTFAGVFSVVMAVTTAILPGY